MSINDYPLGTDAPALLEPLTIDSATLALFGVQVTYTGITIPPDLVKHFWSLIVERLDTEGGA